MIVCIAEKPSVAKDIARILGATTAKDGHMDLRPPMRTEGTQ